MKLELLTNTTVVDDSIRFVTSSDSSSGNGTITAKKYRIKEMWEYFWFLDMIFNSSGNIDQSRVKNISIRAIDYQT
jgi:hypothetical protein